MTLYKWSQTASADATADSTVNWAEGQAPSSVNDSARAMMAAIAKYRDDFAGAIVTSGTSTAYAVTSYQQFDTLAHLDGQVIAFTPHVTNTAGSPNVTLNVDGLGAKTIRADPVNELLQGMLVAGTPYAATYNAAQGLFYLRGFFGNPYNVPLGASMDYWGASAPNSSFALMYGQAISRTTYSALFALLGTTYGVGDGAATFNIPDCRGRVIAGKDDMGGSAANRMGVVVTDNGTIVGATIGSTGGSPTHVLTTSEMPTHSHSVVDPGHVHGYRIGNSGASGTLPLTASSDNFGGTTQSATTGISIQSTGSGGAHAILQPTIIANKLLRII